jgi:hypothetical protein
MPWTRLDDALLDHGKLLEAARLLGGRDGRAKALGWYIASLLYSSKHLTDGHLAPAVVQALLVPPKGVRALVSAGLWQANGHGWLIHDFCEFNPNKAQVVAKRKHDRDRKKNGGKARDRDKQAEIPGVFRADSTRKDRGFHSTRPVPSPSTTRSNARSITRE